VGFFAEQKTRLMVFSSLIPHACGEWILKPMGYFTRSCGDAKTGSQKRTAR
jgi:hypothetical protein